MFLHNYNTHTLCRRLYLNKNGKGKTEYINNKVTNMHQKLIRFHLQLPKADYYDLVVDKKIQKVVEELKALPHDVLIRYLTYWSEAIDCRKYVVEALRKDLRAETMETEGACRCLFLHY